MNDAIENIFAREILDSRGKPTLEVTVSTAAGAATFGVPSGASTGAHEAHERRDGGNHFGGTSVQSVVDSVNTEIAEALKSVSTAAQGEIDQRLRELDGTEDKSRLGGNALIGVSIAVAKSAAVAHGVPVFEHLRTLASIPLYQHVPSLFVNLINGGKHSESALAIQEFHIVTTNASVEDSLSAAYDIQNHVRDRLRVDYGSSSTNIGDEGGFVPSTSSHRDVLRILTETIQQLGLTETVKLSLDVAANSFYTNGAYLLQGNSLTSDELFAHYVELLNEFPLVSIEDPFHEEDFESFAKLLALKRVHVVGDDLTVTNVARVERAIESKSIDSLIIKPNQIGTLSETLTTMKHATESGIKCTVSHRSGETNDDFIADLAYAFGVYGLKAGALQRGERVAKYNRLRQIARM